MAECICQVTQPAQLGTWHWSMRTTSTIRVEALYPTWKEAFMHHGGHIKLACMASQMRTCL